MTALRVDDAPLCSRCGHLEYRHRPTCDWSTRRTSLRYPGTKVARCDCPAYTTSPTTGRL
jgi:hypothetical protein